MSIPLRVKKHDIQIYLNPYRVKHQPYDYGVVQQEHTVRLLVPLLIDLQLGDNFLATVSVGSSCGIRGLMTISLCHDTNIIECKSERTNSLRERRVLAPVPLPSRIIFSDHSFFPHHLPASVWCFGARKQGNVNNSKKKPVREIKLPITQFTACSSTSVG